MDVVEPRYRPDPALDREAMAALQRDLANSAVFTDDLGFDPSAIGIDGEATDGPETNSDAQADETPEADPPVVVGIDQAFRDDEVVSAAVAMRGASVLERVHAAVPVELPYIPGLLAFREAGGIVAALERLSVGPDLLLVDGSGRIHYREAGLATHVGVLFDVPAVGVAKSLLCGRPERSLEEPLPAGARVPILADDEVETVADAEGAGGTTIGYAVQTRQFGSGDRHINPLYVSPGHRVGAGIAADLVLATAAGYKLPEPIRAADRLAGEVARGESD